MAPSSAAKVETRWGWRRGWGRGASWEDLVLQASTFRNKNILVSSASHNSHNNYCRMHVPSTECILKVKVVVILQLHDSFPCLCPNKERHRGTAHVCWNVWSNGRRGTKEEELQLKTVKKDDKSSTARRAVAACVARAVVPERGTRSTAVIILRSARCSSMGDFISCH